MRKIIQTLAIIGFTTFALAANQNSIKQKLAERVAAHPQLVQTASEVFGNEMPVEKNTDAVVLAQTTQGGSVS